MTIRIGLIGCGRWGKLILRDLIASGAEVHVTCLQDDTVADALARGACTASQSLATSAAMDGYVVATPTITHADVITSLLPTGRPIFVEKPMTADLASARRIVAAAGDRLFVMDKWRYHPAIEAMRQEIAHGRIGTPLAVRFARWQWAQPHLDVSPLWILVPHDLSITQHLIGDLPTLTHARLAVAARPDLGATLLFGTGDQPRITMEYGIASPDHRRHCLVIGSQATMELRGGYETDVHIRRGPPADPSATEQVLAVGNAMPLLKEIECFLAFVRGTGPAPLSPTTDALRVVEALTEIDARLALDA